MDGSTRGAGMQGSTETDCWQDKRAASLPLPGLSAPTFDAPSDSFGPRRRMTRLVAALEAEIIPRLVRLHGGAEAGAELQRSPIPPSAPASAPNDEALIRLAVVSYAGDDDAFAAAIHTLRAQGRSVESIFMDVLGPVAKHLGVMWEEDRCSFSDVTVGLGRMQRCLRELSPAFGSEVEPPPGGRRVLLLPAPGEQHTFGLSIVAEFFRREQWDVVLDLGQTMIDPLEAVQAEWFDAVGFSVGHDARLDWLRTCIQGVRRLSRNPEVRVLVGGPVFSLSPQYVEAVGADATATDGREAPRLAASLLAN